MLNNLPNSVRSPSSRCQVHSDEADTTTPPSPPDQDAVYFYGYKLAGAFAAAPPTCCRRRSVFEARCSCCVPPQEIVFRRWFATSARSCLAQIGSLTGEFAWIHTAHGYCARILRIGERARR
jgi:hypothetical protein